jgi:hypothetical protein
MPTPPKHPSDPSDPSELGQQGADADVATRRANINQTKQQHSGDKAYQEILGVRKVSCLHKSYPQLPVHETNRRESIACLSVCDVPVPASEKLRRN